MGRGELLGEGGHLVEVGGQVGQVGQVGELQGAPVAGQAWQVGQDPVGKAARGGDQGWQGRFAKTSETFPETSLKAGRQVRHLARGHRLPAVCSLPQQLVRHDLVLARDQLVDRRVVVQEELHPDERLAALLCQHVPGLWAGQQVGHRALRRVDEQRSLLDFVRIIWMTRNENF